MKPAASGAVMARRQEALRVSCSSHSVSCETKGRNAGKMGAEHATDTAGAASSLERRERAQDRSEGQCCARNGARHDQTGGRRWAWLTLAA